MTRPTASSVLSTECLPSVYYAYALASDERHQRYVTEATLAGQLRQTNVSPCSGDSTRRPGMRSTMTQWLRRSLHRPAPRIVLEESSAAVT